MGLPTVLIAVRGFEASHMATLSNVTINVSYSGGEAHTVVDYWTGLVGVTYTDASSKAVIASDVDEMVCVAPDYPAGVDDDRGINGTGVEIKNLESGKCLDVWSASGSDVPDYTNVDFYSCSGASNQVFTYDGSTIKHAASGKCLDNDASNGDSVQIFSCSGASNQAWTAMSSSGAILNKATGKCLDVLGGGTADGTDVWTYTCTGATSQQWYFEG